MPVLLGQASAKLCAQCLGHIGQLQQSPLAAQQQRRAWQEIVLQLTTAGEGACGLEGCLPERLQNISGRAESSFLAKLQRCWRLP